MQSNIKLTTEEFIDRSKKVHGDKYDCSKVDYKNYHTDVIIICPIHGEFKQKPSVHLLGCGCPKCGVRNGAEKRVLSYNQILEKFKKTHGGIFDYSRVDYKGYDDKVIIICKEHGEFYQTPHEHITGSGCLKCSIKKQHNIQKLTTEEFINRADIKQKNNKFNYSLVDYKDSKTPVKIICSAGHTFEQIPNNHLCGAGCPKCVGGGTSLLEKQIYNFVLGFFPTAIENTRHVIPPLELDIYIPELRLAIEFNGLYYHSDGYKHKTYHLEKTIACEKQGIHLIHIYEDDWNFKKDIVKSRLVNLFGMNSIKIYGRDCENVELDKKSTKEFLNINHLQGSTPSTINLGLTYKGEIVCVMTFGKRRLAMGKKSTEDGEYELLRFANKNNTTVHGSANKLFLYFLKKYQPKKIMSYADRSWTMNNGKTIYDNLGFKIVGETPPNYYYVVDGVRKHRFGFQKAKLVKKGFDVSKTEKVIMEELGISSIYNSGNLSYLYI